MWSGREGRADIATTQVEKESRVRYHSAILAAAAGLAASTASADVIFSFASDTDHTSFTFGGFGSGVGDAQDAGDTIELLIDDTNGSGSPLTYTVEFNAAFTIDYAGSVNMGGGLFVHTYRLNGQFGYYDLSGSPVLTAAIENGALTAMGGQDSWSSTSTVFGADGDASSVEYTWHLADNAGYGLYNGVSVGPADDAAFTLTFLQSDNGSGVALGSDMLPDSEWVSEGSYSGTATFVPTPASMAVLGLGGLAALRRRR